MNKKTFKFFIIFILIFIFNATSSIVVSSYSNVNMCEHNWFEISREEPSCLENGYIDYCCEFCFQNKTEPIFSKGHMFVITNCESGGRASCRNCGITDKTIWYEPKEHMLIEFGRQEPTDCSGGYIFYKCENCTAGVSAYYEDPQYPHIWTEIYRENASCGNSGYIQYRCENCHIGKSEPLPATGNHSYYWVSNQDATCTEDGTKKLNCEICGIKDSEAVIDEGSAFGHNFGDTWTVLTNATCSQTGVSIRICKRCMEIETIIQPAYGHNDKNNDNKCDECTCLLSESGILETPDIPEQSEEESTVLSFFIKLLNTFSNFFKKLFRIK